MPEPRMSIVLQKTRVKQAFEEKKQPRRWLQYLPWTVTTTAATARSRERPWYNTSRTPSLASAQVTCSMESIKNT